MAKRKNWKNITRCPQCRRPKSKNDICDNCKQKNERSVRMFEFYNIIYNAIKGKL